MNAQSDINFKALNQAGVSVLMEWAAAEGWNPGKYDAEAFYQTDPEGFIGMYIGEDLIGGGAIISYDGKFGFMGLFIVAKNYRGQGLGNELWYKRRDMLLKRLEPGASIGMDGVVQMQGFYAKGGFELSFRSERHCIKGRQCAIDARVHALSSADFDEVCHYDIEIFGVDRPRFLKNWLHMKNVIAFKVQDKGIFQGYTVMRRCIEGYKICPLFANDFHSANGLLQACLNAASQQNVYIDIPMINPEALKLAQAYQSSYVFECGRMYYGRPTELPWQKVYGVTTFELG
jgi:GNAT superfamily N-acetyltransferase